ncbi:MAG: hypothetical protein ACREQP_08205 [Candidatus Binatia bacterium]
MDRVLDAKFAEAVMGWKDVHRVQVGKGAGDYFGKRPDKLGRFRKVRVPEFCKDPGVAADIQARMKQLGLWKRYETELSKATHAKGLPSDWATPEQACRAALKVVGRSSLRAVK